MINLNYMKNQKLKRMVLFVGIICVIFGCGLGNVHADVYKDGLITAKHEELPVKRDGQRIQFDQPHKLSEAYITNVLSSIHYEEKGLFKKKDILRVFYDEEIKKLIPLIVRAFSIATQTQVITVTSYSYRMILSDKKNYRGITFAAVNTISCVPWTLALLYPSLSQNMEQVQMKQYSARACRRACLDIARIAG